jgi:hypothetical protein
MAILMTFALSAFANPPNLASMNWSATAQRSLAAHKPSDDAITDFLDSIYPDMKLLSQPEICYAKFANLRHSGNLSFVVSTASRMFCYTSIIDKTEYGFESYDLSDNEELGEPEIRDLKSDGKFEVIIPMLFSGYYGANHCMASWPVIYAWTGSAYSDVSSQYKNYYERQLAALKKQIAVAGAKKERAQAAAAAPAAPVWNCRPQAASGGESPVPAAPGTKIGTGVSFDGVGVARICSPAPPPAMPEPDRLGLDCDRAEAAKLERFVGISRDAGMSDAIKWANSEDPHDREFAADVLADIGTQQAVEYLKKLTHDPNRLVEMSAKSGLAQVKQGPVAHTVDEQAIPLSALDAHR